MQRLIATALMAVVLGAGAGATRAVEVSNLEGLEDIFGTYAPAGDCKREPRITVEVSGVTFEVAGKKQKVTNLEFAASYGGNFYQGIAKWIFPFRMADGYPILMSFNGDEKPGTLAIDGHDRGYAGGPAATPLEAALIKGSPYKRCP